MGRRHAARRGRATCATLAPGEVRFAPQRDVALAAHRGRVSGRDAVAAGGVDYALVPLMDDQELDSRASTGTIYWEGAVRAQREGARSARAYLELTGYWKPLQL